MLLPGFRFIKSDNSFPKISIHERKDLFKGNRREPRDGSLENPIQEVRWLRHYEICNLNTGTQKIWKGCCGYTSTS